MLVKTTYLGRECEIRLSAELGSNRITIEVDGKSAVVSVQSAERMIHKLRAAIDCANAN